MLPVGTLEMRKSFLSLSLAKPSQNDEAISYICKLHIYGGIHYTLGESNGKLPLGTCPGCSVPEPYQSPD